MPLRWIPIQTQLRLRELIFRPVYRALFNLSSTTSVVAYVIDGTQESLVTLRSLPGYLRMVSTCATPGLPGVRAIRTPSHTDPLSRLPQ